MNSSRQSSSSQSQRKKLNRRNSSSRLQLKVLELRVILRSSYKKEKSLLGKNNHHLLKFPQLKGRVINRS